MQSLIPHALPDPVGGLHVSTSQVPFPCFHSDYSIPILSGVPYVATLRLLNLAAKTSASFATPLKYDIIITSQSLSFTSHFQICFQNLWICLICGHIGCGRYEGGHANMYVRLYVLVDIEFIHNFHDLLVCNLKDWAP